MICDCETRSMFENQKHDSLYNKLKKKFLSFHKFVALIIARRY